MFDPKMKLGEFLLSKNLISKPQLDQALEEQKTNQKPLGEILISSGVLKEDDLLQFFSKQFNYEIVDRNKDFLECEAQGIIEKFFSEEYLLRNQFFPLSLDSRVLKIAIVNPLDLVLLDNLKVLVGCEIHPFVAPKDFLINSIKNYFNESQKVKLEVSEEENSEEVNLSSVMSEASEGQVVRVVNLLIIQAVEEFSSDIHFEPLVDGSLQIRYRIDGILFKRTPPPKELSLPIISRIKILSHMDISEKRLPQDGSMAMVVDGKDIDLRVSTIPTIYGEKVVIRILDKTTSIFQVDNLGLSAKSLKAFKVNLAKNSGMLLVTGPTGSGKTTTLYAALNHMNDVSRNIVSIEDPVEYKLQGVIQVNVKPDIGLDFSDGLRAFLRQDPDIIMVGEVRDKKTAVMSVQAAMTGHFVLTTLHTSSAFQAIERLINMGLELISITSSLSMVIAQRLLRKLCEKCKKKVSPTKELLKRFNLKADQKVFKPVGCEHCRSGYKGRVGIYETVVLDDTLKNMILKGNFEKDLKTYALKNGMIDLRDAAFEKVFQGETSLEEAISFLD